MENITKSKFTGEYTTPVLNNVKVTTCTATMPVNVNIEYTLLINI